MFVEENVFKMQKTFTVLKDKLCAYAWEYSNPMVQVFFWLASAKKKNPAHNYATMWIVRAQLICMHLTDATFHRPGYEKWLSLSVCSLLLVPLEGCSSVPPRLFVYWLHFIYRSGKISLSVDSLCNKHLSHDRVEALNAEVQHAEAAHYRDNAALWWRPIVTVDFHVDCTVIIFGH